MKQDMFLSSLTQHLELVETLLPQPPVVLGLQVCKLSQQLILFSERQSKQTKNPHSVLSMFFQRNKKVYF